MEAIIISGLAASGKSTLARRLAKRYGIKYVCGGDVLKEIARECGYNVGEHWWDTEEGMRFLEERKRNPEYDRLLDQKLMKIADAGNCVITSWALPWIYRGKCIKIWLEVSLPERARRLARRDGISLEEAMKIVKKRDIENKELYRRIYGFDFEDRSVFHMVIDAEKKSEEEVEEEVSMRIESILRKK